MVEQLNQTFTILVSLRAVEKLIELHPEAESGSGWLWERRAGGISRALNLIWSQRRYSPQLGQTAIKSCARTSPIWQMTLHGIDMCSLRHPVMRQVDRRNWKRVPAASRCLRCSHDATRRVGSALAGHPQRGQSQSSRAGLRRCLGGARKE